MSKIFDFLFKKVQVNQDNTDKAIVSEIDYIKPFPKKNNQENLSRFCSLAEYSDEQGNLLEGLEGLNVEEREMLN